MRVEKYIHSCLQIEKNGARLLFDPGKFSFADREISPERFEGLAGIVLTHYHPDHVEESILERILEKNRDAVILANAHICGKLAERGLACETFESGTRSLAGFTIEARDAPHAKILGSTPPPNTAYAVDGKLLHPGDSFDESLDEYKNIEVLALPVMAPWCTELAAAAFAERLSPKRVIPIHDGYAKPFFLESRYQNFGKYFGECGLAFTGLSQPGDGVDV